MPAKFPAANFAAAKAGFITATTATDRTYMQRDENMLLARFANLLSRYTGNEAYHKMSERAMRYLVAPQIAKYLPTGGTLLANLEFSTDPIHITVVGLGTIQQPRHCSMPAMRIRRVICDWNGGTLARAACRTPDIARYPELKNAAAFICTGNTCSSPIYKPETVRASETDSRSLKNRRVSFRIEDQHGQEYLCYMVAQAFLYLC